MTELKTGAPSRIMIVEGDLMVAKDLKRRLRILGYDVSAIASGGLSAIELARETMPHLVLMDVMPAGDMDGVEAAGVIQTSLGIPIVFVTACTEDHVVDRAMEAEPFGYLVRPFTEKELRSTIETALVKSRAERALVRAKDEWERTFDAVPDLIIILDDKHRIVQANKATVERLGIQREEIVGKSCFECFHQTASPPAFCPHSVLLVDGKPHFAEVSEERLDTVFEVSVSPLHDLDGRLIGSVHVAHDITARKKAELNLKQSEERYRMLVEHANDIVFRTDAAGRFAFVNPVVLRITGYSAEEVIGRPYLDFVHPEHKDEMKRFYEFQFLKKIPETYYQYRLITKAGKSVWMAQHGQLLMEEDSVTGFQAIARDITARKEAEDALRRAHHELEERVLERTSELARANAQLKESEARVRSLFEAAEDCVFVQDRDLAYTLVNPAMERLLGRPASEMLGRTDEDLFGEETGKHTREVSARVLRGQSVEVELSRMIRGEWTTFHETRAPLRDSSGTVIGVCGIARDITERKAAVTHTPSDATACYASPIMRRTLENARLAAETGGIVLLTGESGSGKDHMARYIHDHSSRCHGPYFAVNCGAIAPQIAESEFFGHERGAFTGADSRKRGLLELAEGGTLLLNEIGELSLDLQVKLLTFLDTRGFTRVGGEKRITVEARIIAATNRDLAKEVEAGRFRQDLFYRLHVFNIEVPPLRKRRNDIPALAEIILAQLKEDLQLHETPCLDSSTLSKLVQYHWPGNVRELRNVLERALILSKGQSLRVDLGSVHGPAGDEQSWSAVFPPRKPLNEIAQDLKRSLILEALEHSKGNKTRAANILKISRDALRQQMKTLGLL